MSKRSRSSIEPETARDEVEVEEDEHEVIGGSGSSVPPSQRPRTSRSQRQNRPETATPSIDIEFQNDIQGTYRAGSIEELILRNIMCHKHLKVKFGPRINWICGENGSGKSAVLAGIEVALGSSARFTGRTDTRKRGTRGKEAAGSGARGLGELVTSGESSGTIILALHNRGADGFEHDKYGDRIIIERKITRAGTSSYKITSSLTKEVVSTRKAELDRILAHYNIQINPIIFHNQHERLLDKAVDEPVKFYNTISDATLLQKALDNIHMLTTHIREMEKGLAEKREELPMLEDEKTRRQAAVNGLERVDKFNDELKQLKIDLEWSKIIDAEGVLDVKKEKFEKLSRYIEKIGKRIAEYESNIQQLQEQSNKFDEESRELEKQIEESRSAVQGIDAKIKEIYHERNSVKQDKKRLEAEIKSENKCINGYKRDIQRSEAEKLAFDRNSREAQARITEIGRMIREKREALAALSRELDSARSSTSQQFDVDRLEYEAKEADKVYKDANWQLRRASDELTKLKKDDGRDGQDLDRFFRGAKRLNQEIGKNISQFSQRPIGPLGQYVKVKDEKWLTCVEHMLQGFTARYICNTFKDSALLLRIAKGIGINNLNTSTFPFAGGRYSQNPNQLIPPPRQGDKYVRAMDVLEFTNHIVFNAAEESVRFPQAAFTDDMDLGRSLVFRKARQNVGNAFVLTRGTSYKLFQSGPTQSESPLGKAWLVYSVDRSHQIARAEQELGAARAEAETAKVKAADTKRALVQARSASTAVQRRISRLEKQEENLQDAVNTMEDEQYDLRAKINDAAEDEGDAADDAIEEAKKNIVESEERIKELDSKIELCVESIEKLEGRIDVLRREMNDKVKGDSDCADRSLKLSVDVARCGRLIDDNKTRKIQEERKKMERLTESTGLKAVIDEEQSQLDAKIQQLTIEIGPRVVPDKSTNRIEIDIKGLTELIESEAREQGGTAEELRDALRDAVRRFDDVTARIEQNDEFRLAMTEKQKRQMADFKHLRELTFKALSMVFGRNMRLVNENSVGRSSDSRGGGRLRSDHKAGHMEIFVHKPGDSSDINDVKSLSGGERALTMVALVLSLWEQVNCPLFCWDEYEMMMDAINRDQATRVIVLWIKARSPYSPQLFLVSPRATEIVDDPLYSDWVHVLKLAK